MDLSGSNEFSFTGNQVKTSNVQNEIFYKQKAFKGQSGHTDSVSAVIYDDIQHVLYSASLDKSIKVYRSLLFFSKNFTTQIINRIFFKNHAIVFNDECNID